MTEQPPHVKVTRHAVDRLVDRGGFKGWSREKIAGLIIVEVQDALKNDRVRNKPPRFTRLGGGKIKSSHEGARFAWDPGEQRCYVFRKVKGTKGPIMLVMTVIMRVGS